MWNATTGFLLKLQAHGLSHEAVIEIMVALLGVMVAILALIAFIFSLGLVLLGVIGVAEIRHQARKKAKEVATKTAGEVATRVANKRMNDFIDENQASGLSESQAEEAPRLEEEPIKTALRAEGPLPNRRSKATNDRSLKR